MQKVIARATVAICTLSTGIACSLLANYLVQSIPLGDVPAVRLSPTNGRDWLYIPVAISSRDLPAVRLPPTNGQWKRVDIDGTFSFYLPLSMTPTELPGDYWGPAGAYADDNLIVSFTYSKRLSCEPDRYVTRFDDFQTADVIIAGRAARLETFQIPNSVRRSMVLCFPDIGDHETKLHLGATSSHADALNVAKQIFDSVEFR